MAITYLGDGGRGAGTANVTYSIPSGTQTGDLLLMVIETANQTVITPGEWLDVPDSPQGIDTAGGTTATRLKIMYRWVDGTSIVTTVTDPGNHQVGTILAFRGVDPTNPFNASAGSTKATANTACTFPSVTTTVDNCLVLLAEAHALPDSNTSGQTSNQTMASLTGLAEEVDYNTNSGNGGGFSVAAGIKATAGSTGTGSATHSTSTADATITLALAPAPEAQSLTPTRYDNASTIYTPTITVGSVALSPALYSNAQTFYSPTVVGAIPQQDLLPSLYSNAQTFFSATVSTSNTLAASLVTNTQVFYSATVSVGQVTLAPSLYSNTQVFYTPVVSTQAVQLAPSLYGNAQTFYSPSVQPGAVSLDVSLYSNGQTFYPSTVTVGGVVLSADLLSNSQTFYTPVIQDLGVSIQPTLYTNNQAFYTPTVETLSSPQTLVAHDWVDSGWVESGWVSFGSFNQQAFYSASLVTGEVSLAPSRLDNDQTFFVASVSVGVVQLEPALVENSHEFFSAYVSRVELQELSAALFTNLNIIFPAQIRFPGEAVLAGNPKPRRRQEEFINWVPSPAFDDAAAKKARRRRNELLLL